MDRSIDVYHNWPGFFLVATMLVWLTHIDVMTLARYAEPFFGIVTGWAMFYAAGGLTRDRRLRWATVAVFTLTNWIGQGYFAPQAMAIVLMLLFFGSVLRVMTGVNSVGDQRLSPMFARFVRRRRLRPQGPSVDRRRSVASQVAPMLVFAALAVTHQLTPVSVLLQLVALGFVARLRPWWMIVVPFLIEGAWLALAWPYLHQHTKLFSFDLTQNIKVPGAAVHASLPGVTTAQWSGPLIMATTAVLALIGVVVQWRRGVINVSAVVLAGSPGIVLTMNSYGSEALFRVYLYALPWLAFLAAQALVPSASTAQAPGVLVSPVWSRRAQRVKSKQRKPIWLSPGWLLARQTAVAVALLPMCLTASFFLDKANIVVREDISTAQWFELNTPADAFVVMVAPSYPTRLTAAYPSHIIEDGAFAPAVTSWMEPTGKAGDAILGARKLFHVYNWRPGYLVFTPTQRNYAQMWGLLTGAQYDRLEQLVATSKDYRVVHRDGAGLVAKYLGPR
jgi:hypothetical protein